MEAATCEAVVGEECCLGIPPQIVNGAHQILLSANYETLLLTVLHVGQVSTVPLGISRSRDPFCATSLASGVGHGKV